MSLNRYMHIHIYTYICKSNTWYIYLSFLGHFCRVFYANCLALAILTPEVWQREPPWREWNEVCVCVCGGGWEALFIALQVGSRQVHVWKEVHWPRLLEMHLDGWPARFSRPRGSTGPTWPPLVLILLWQADTWTFILILLCIFRGAPVFSTRWTLLVSVWRQMRSSA